MHPSESIKSFKVTYTDQKDINLLLSTVTAKSQLNVRSLWLKGCSKMKLAN